MSRELIIKTVAKAIYTKKTLAESGLITGDLLADVAQKMVKLVAR